MSGQFKSFVSEEEVQEQRKQRQADWERVRKPEDPKECPEEETRSLFEQLEANKDLKDRELEEDTKLRSSVKGLDEDEVQFLDFVSNRQMQIEKDRTNEDKAVLEELRIASVLKVQDKKKPASSDTDRTPAASQGSSSASKSSQKQLLLGAIKRKSSDGKSDAEEKIRKTDAEEKIRKTDAEEKIRKTDHEEDNNRPDAKLMAGIPRNSGATMVVAGILPGIADYEDSDSSTENDSNSSDSEADHMIMPSIATQRILQEMMLRLKEEGCG